ncbi:ribosome maturation factor RimP [Chrysiogenes arsenatis]|uniref:ribosome maturation factor RimP n=1 Tax=Chrysiogenes arsenatis TaxID=309797 RepID=UPI0004276C6B|nr:ribosome maturation factor RimP [Chrysiogenes arsenatis]
MEKEHIIATVTTLAEPILADRGLELFDIELINASGWYLRVYIDRPGGVTLDDCEGVSVELSNILDVEDVVGVRYNLEVSSPGINRKIRGVADFQSHLGKLARVKLSEPLLNTKLHMGYIEYASAEHIILKERDRGIPIEIPVTQIEKANLEYEWE